VNGIRPLCGLPKKGQRTNNDGFAKTKLKFMGLDDVITIIYEKIYPTLAYGKAHVDSISTSKGSTKKHVDQSLSTRVGSEKKHNMARP
jgi:hypothetical protein